MKIFFSGYRDSRHSRFGGYDKIAFFPKSSYLNAEKLPFGFIEVGKHGKKLNLLFLDFFTRLKKNKFDVIHFFYGDFMLFRPVPEEKKSKFVVTVHMNAKELSLKKITILKSYDAVVVLSSSQEKYLRNLGVNAYFIPHGFDVPIFNQKDYVGFDRSKINVFYSGTNYRDFDTFLLVVKTMEAIRNDMHFYAVGQSSTIKEILKLCKNVTICPFLDDDTYYSLLSDCDCNFLPLTFATANNALLEAQNLGVLSILPKIEGILDYADSENNLYYETSEDVIKIFTALKKNSKLVYFAERFAWKNIYEKLEKLYGDLLK